MILERKFRGFQIQEESIGLEVWLTTAKGYGVAPTALVAGLLLGPSPDGLG